MAKNAYIGVDGKARTVKRMFIGVPTTVTKYTSNTVTTNVTTSNISNVFTVTLNGWTGSGSSWTYSKNTYGSQKLTLTAKSAMQVSFNYSFSGLDSGTSGSVIYGNTKIWSGYGTSKSGTISGYLNAGSTIIISISGDSDNGSSGSATISNIVTKVTTTTSNGTETKEVARKIIRGWVGDSNGKARLFYAQGAAPVRHGVTPTGLNYATMNMRSSVAGNYAVFVGGYNGVGGASSDDKWYYPYAYAYDSSLAKHSVPDYPGGQVMEHTMASVAGHAIVAGGHSWQNGYSSTYAYPLSPSLTWGNNMSRSVKASQAGGVSLGNYAIIAGGTEHRTATATAAKKAIDVYESTLTRNATARNFTNNYTNNNNRWVNAIGNKALFLNGSYAETINTSLTVSSPAVETFAGVSFNTSTLVDDKYIVYMRPTSTSDNKSIMRAYDSSLTMTIMPNVSYNGYWCTSTSLGDYGIFKCGSSSHQVGNTVLLCSPSLTVTSITGTSVAKSNCCGQSIGDKALFAGGNTSTTVDNTPTTTVDVYKLA